MIEIAIAVFTIWAAAAGGVLKASTFMDGWERTCREYYWPERLRSNRAFVLLLVSGPLGLLVALYCAHLMSKHPLEPPAWAYEMQADLEKTGQALKALDEAMAQTTASLDEAIKTARQATEAIKSEGPRERDCNADEV